MRDNHGGGGVGCFIRSIRKQQCIGFFTAHHTAADHSGGRRRMFLAISPKKRMIFGPAYCVELYGNEFKL